MIIKKKNWGCYRIFCVGEDFAPPGPGGLGLEKNFFLDNNQVKIKQMTPSRVQALQRENTD